MMRRPENVGAFGDGGNGKTHDQGVVYPATYRAGMPVRYTSGPYPTNPWGRREGVDCSIRSADCPS